MPIEKPNFIIAGVIAGGTSFLSAALASHPEVYMPRIQRPEPNFFMYTRKFTLGLNWYLNTWFSEVEGQKAIGERSSLLLSSSVAPARMKEAFPDLKIILCLRNPIERAWANYRFTVLEGLEPMSIDEALDMEAARLAEADDFWREVRPHAYTARSMYADDLERYIDVFGRDKILMLCSEVLGVQPAEELRKVCEFLEVDTSFTFPPQPNYSSPSVNDRVLQNEMRKYFGDRFPTIIEQIRKNHDFASSFSDVADLQRIEALKANLVGRKETLSDFTRERLRQVFATDIARVAEIVPFSTTHWT